MNLMIGWLSIILLLLYISWISASIQTLSSTWKHVPRKISLELDTWKYHGDLVRIYKLFKSVTVDIKIPNQDENVHMYQASNETELQEKFENGQRIFGFLHKWTLWQSKKLLPFEDRLIGLETLHPYSIRLDIQDYDLKLVMLFLCGLVLFLSAKKLSRNIWAFYVGGSTTGVILSLVLLLFIFYKFLPMKRNIAILSAITGAASINFYLLFWMWQNIFNVLKLYQKFVLIYLVLIGAISFAFCYKVGPPKDIKSKNLIQWTIQVLGLVLVYNACQITNISIVLIVFLPTVYFSWKFLVNAAYKIRFRFFPPKRRLMTDDEFLREGLTETKKALDKLRSFCQSPKCDSWKYMSRLKNPKKFASFVSGDSHISDQEVRLYDSVSINQDMSSNDVDTDDDEDQNSFYPENFGEKSTKLDRSLPNVLGRYQTRRSQQTFFNNSFNPTPRFYEYMAKPARNGKI